MTQSSGEVERGGREGGLPPVELAGQAGREGEGDRARQAAPREAGWETQNKKFPGWTGTRGTKM